MKGGIVRTRRFVVLAALIGTGVCTPATAAVTTERASVAMPLTQGPVSTVTAKCPSGTNLVSGGWKGSAGVTQVIESQRVGRRAWRVTAGRFTNDLTPSILTAFAHCDEQTTRATSVTRTFNGNDEFEITGTTGRCPGRRRAVSGGFHILGDSVFAADAVISTSARKGGSSWRTAAYPFSSFATVEATTYCIRLDDALRKRVGADTSEDNDVDVRTRRCRGTMSVGFRAENPGQANPIVVEHLIRKRNLGVLHGHDADGTGLSLKAFAYCPRP